VVKLKFVCGTANYTLTPVTFPNLDFDSGRYKTSASPFNWRRNREVLFTLDGNKLEPKYVPIPIVLHPSVHKVKYPIVGPDPLL
jgi:hypothetical protein